MTNPKPSDPLPDPAQCSADHESPDAALRSRLAAAASEPPLAGRILIGSQRHRANPPQEGESSGETAPADQVPMVSREPAVAQPPLDEPEVAETDDLDDVGSAVALPSDTPNDEPPHTAQATTVQIPRPTRSRPPRQASDLEYELQQAMGDVPLDQLLADTRAHSQSEAGELAVDTRCQATVLKVDREWVFVALGTRDEGVIPLHQFRQPPQAGAAIDVIVSAQSAEDGLYTLALPGASVEVADWSDLREGALVEALVTGHNKGGLECEVNHIRGFIPASQIALYHVEDLDPFVGQRLQCVVTEANPLRRNLVLSHRAILEREKAEAKQRFFDALEVGQVLEGTVRSLRDFGAFVDLGGFDGLVHISQLSWDRVTHPSEVLEEGQRIQVKVDKVDRESGRISLSYRALMEHPWANVAERFPVNSIVTGTVTRLAPYGAFVKLAPGVEGLVHISELAHHRVARVSQVVQEGQTIQVKVLSVDHEGQKIGLSLKGVQPAAEQQPESEDQEPPDKPVGPPQRDRVLRGGINRPTGGEQFGLKW